MARLPAWQVSFKLPSHGGYSTVMITANKREEAVAKGRKEVVKWYPNPKPTAIVSVARKFSIKEEEEAVLERLYNVFRSTYIKNWEPKIKGTVLIQKSKKSLGKEKWGRVWFR